MSSVLTDAGARTNVLAAETKSAIESGVDASAEFAELWQSVEGLLSSSTRQIASALRKRGSDDELSATLMGYAWERLLTWDPELGAFSTWLVSGLRSVADALALQELRPGDTRYYYEVLTACRQVPNFEELSDEDLAEATGYPTDTITAAFAWVSPVSIDAELTEDGNTLAEILGVVPAHGEYWPSEVADWYATLPSAATRYDAFCLLRPDDPEAALSARKYGESHTVLGRDRATRIRRNLIGDLKQYLERSHAPDKH